MRDMATGRWFQEAGAVKYEGGRRKTEQSPSLSSTDHWQDKEEERRRGEIVQGEGSSRGHEALEA